MSGFAASFVSAGSKAFYNQPRLTGCKFYRLANFYPPAVGKFYSPHLPKHSWHQVDRQFVKKEGSGWACGVSSPTLRAESSAPQDKSDLEASRSFLGAVAFLILMEKAEDSDDTRTHQCLSY